MKAVKSYLILILSLGMISSDKTYSDDDICRAFEFLAKQESLPILTVEANKSVIIIDTNGFVNHCRINKKNTLFILKEFNEKYLEYYYLDSVVQAKFFNNKAYGIYFSNSDHSCSFEYILSFTKESQGVEFVAVNKLIDNVSK